MAQIGVSTQKPACCATGKGTQSKTAASVEDTDEAEDSEQQEEASKEATSGTESEEEEQQDTPVGELSTTDIWHAICFAIR